MLWDPSPVNQLMQPGHDEETAQVVRERDNRRRLAQNFSRFVELGASSFRSKLIFAVCVTTNLMPYPYGIEWTLLGGYDTTTTTTTTERTTANFVMAKILCLDQITNTTEGWRNTVCESAASSKDVLVVVLMRMVCALEQWEDLLVILDRSKPILHREALIIACTEEMLEAFASRLVRKTPWVLSNVLGPFLAEVLGLTASKGALSVIFSALMNPHYCGLLLQHEAQLQAVTDRMYLISSAHRGFPLFGGLFTYCIRLVELFPHFVQELTTRYVSDLEALSSDRYSLLGMLNGWDALLVTEIAPTVLHFIREHVTVPFVNAMLNSLERLQPSFPPLESNTTKFVEEVLLGLTRLCLFDHQAQNLLLRFSENLLVSMAPQGVSPRIPAALVLIPLALSNANIPDHLATSALEFACEPGAPWILESLFSVKQLINSLTAVESVQNVFTATVRMCLLQVNQTQFHDPFAPGCSTFGPLYHMLNLCPTKILESLPEFIEVVKAPISTATDAYNILQIHRMNSEVCISGRWIQIIDAIHLRKSSIEPATLLATLELITALRSTTSTMELGLTDLENLLIKYFRQTESIMVPPNNEIAITLAKRFPLLKRREMCASAMCDGALIGMESVIYCCEPQINARRTPFITVSSSSSDTLCRLVSRCVCNVSAWKEDELIELVRHSQVDPSSIILRGRDESLLDAVIRANNVPLAIQLLPFCNPHLPLSILARAILSGTPQMIDLLRCYGMIIPDNIGNIGSSSSSSLSESHHSVLVRSRERGVLDFLRNPATWDPSKHIMFPWWFKQQVLFVVLLCWLRNSTTDPTETPHQIGRLPSAAIHHVLSFLAPNHWL
ncbi:hypothetical protein Pelo_3047 [Pelomyxa schiedti]|nr:hypothetical protein Pelo_3047 [Pelomyxa schiedti]